MLRDFVLFVCFFFFLKNLYYFYCSHPFDLSVIVADAVQNYYNIFLFS